MFEAFQAARLVRRFAARGLNTVPLVEGGVGSIVPGTLVKATTFEEKGSDVNLATDLNFDAATCCRPSCLRMGWQVWEGLVWLGCLRTRDGAGCGGPAPCGFDRGWVGSGAGEFRDGLLAAVSSTMDCWLAAAATSAAVAALLSARGMPFA